MKTNLTFFILLLILCGVNTKLAAQAENIKISHKVNPDKSIDLHYQKKKPGSYTIGLSFSNLTNCDIKNYKQVISGYSSFLVKLRPIESNKGVGYTVWYYTILGNLNSKADTLFKYALPFKDGKNIKVATPNNLDDDFFTKPVISARKVLSENSKVQQQNKISDTLKVTKHRKNYIFESGTADTIYSMRKGIVVKIVNDYLVNEAIQTRLKKNAIIVEHEDGTMATYFGFKKNGISVALGDNVNPGTELGILGITEKGTYKLNFGVYYLMDKNFKSHEEVDLRNYRSMYKFINPTFITQEGDVQIESGNVYTALVNEAIITKEFSKSEKKKYAKNQQMLNKLSYIKY